MRSRSTRICWRSCNKASRPQRREEYSYQRIRRSSSETDGDADGGGHSSDRNCSFWSCRRLQFQGSPTKWGVAADGKFTSQKTERKNKSLLRRTHEHGSGGIHSFSRGIECSRNHRWLGRGVRADFRETVENLDQHISGDYRSDQRDRILV